MSEYVKTCSFCKQEIKMSDRDGKWHPYNKDGSLHTCNKKQDPNGRDDLSVEVLLKRLESVGIKIDLNKLRNVK